MVYSMPGIYFAQIRHLSWSGSTSGLGIAFRTQIQREFGGVFGWIGFEAQHVDQ